MPDYLREYYNENGSRKVSPNNFTNNNVKIIDELTSPRDLSPIKEAD